MAPDSSDWYIVQQLGIQQLEKTKAQARCLSSFYDNQVRKVEFMTSYRYDFIESVLSKALFFLLIFESAFDNVVKT